MRTLLEIYFGINLFIAGYYLCKEWRWAKDYAEKISVIIWTIGTLILGLPYVIISIIIGLLRVLIDTINRKYYLRTLYLIFFTNHFENLSEQALKHINKFKVDNPKSLSDKIANYCVKKINQKNLNKEIDAVLKRNEK